MKDAKKDTEQKKLLDRAMKIVTEMDNSMWMLTVIAEGFQTCCRENRDAALVAVGRLYERVNGNKEDISKLIVDYNKLCKEGSADDIVRSKVGSYPDIDTPAMYSTNPRDYMPVDPNDVKKGDFTTDTTLHDGYILKNGNIQYYPGSDVPKKWKEFVDRMNAKIDAASKKKPHIKEIDIVTPPKKRGGKAKKKTVKVEP